METKTTTEILPDFCRGPLDLYREILIAIPINTPKVRVVIALLTQKQLGSSHLSEEWGSIEFKQTDSKLGPLQDQVSV